MSTSAPLVRDYVFAPGGLDRGNIYTDWDTLAERIAADVMTALVGVEVNAARVRILLDPTNAPGGVVTIPAGVWSDGEDSASFGKFTIESLTATRAPVIFDDGCFFSERPVRMARLSIGNNGDDVAVFDAASGAVTCVLEDVDYLVSSGAYLFTKGTSGAESIVCRRVTIGDDVPFVANSAHDTSIDLYERSSIGQNTLSDGGTTFTVRYDASSSVSTTQDNLTGAAALVRVAMWRPTLFVFAPGGTDTGSMYADWFRIEDAIGTEQGAGGDQVQGAVTIGIDTNAGAATVNAKVGSLSESGWELPPFEILGLRGYKPALDFVGSTGPDIPLQIARFPRRLQNLTLSNTGQPSSAALFTASGDSIVELRGVDVATAASPIFATGDNAELHLYGCQIADGVKLIKVTSPGTVFLVLHEGSYVGSNTLDGTGTVAVVGDVGTQCSSTQTASFVSRHLSNASDTAGRPLSPILGDLHFDEDLVEWIFWNGAVWKDFAGATV
jgi:hypothetical protein